MYKLHSETVGEISKEADAKFVEYFNDYIDGLSNYTKELGEYRVAKYSPNSQNGKLETLFDEISDINDEFDYEKVMRRLQEQRQKKPEYIKGEPMSASTYNELMRAGSDEPPINFVPRDVIIGDKSYKEIWLNNHKQVSSVFFQKAIAVGCNDEILILKMSDGYTYYAKIDINGVPTFYKRVITKGDK